MQLCFRDRCIWVSCEISKCLISILVITPGTCRLQYYHLPHRRGMQNITSYTDKGKIRDLGKEERGKRGHLSQAVVIVVPEECPALIL